ncbi:MAG TPA: SprT family zinc-dependent metalloprotease [Burkholderiaceae bacterium]|nr:SprT family zinc-dependent metalloprotease [Burkholderiaceae bacterium]
MRTLVQLTLDLFDGLREPAPPATPTPPRSRKKKAAAPVPPAQSAPEKIANDLPPLLPATPVLPPMSLPDALAPARFAHPRANREVRLGHAQVAYEFARGQRRTIGFLVGVDGLTVRAPRWVALRDVDAALQEKSAWILRKLVEVQQRDAQQQAGRIEWRDAAMLPFLGQPVELRIDPGHRFDGVGAVLDATEGEGPAVLRLAIAHSADAAQIRDAAQAWLMRQARRVFLERLEHFAPQLGVRWTKLSLSNAATRWGSASADGSIRLNWRLIHFRLDIIDYVVVHELAHLRVMDHSPRFWDQVERVLPDYAQRRKVLKDEPAPRWN